MLSWRRAAADALISFARLCRYGRIRGLGMRMLIPRGSTLTNESSSLYSKLRGVETKRLIMFPGAKRV
jgi:hypothetical protein